MGTRRVVTGTDEAGRSYFVSDSESPTADGATWASLMPEERRKELVQLWMTTPQDPLGHEKSLDEVFPPPGGTNFQIGMIPPDAGQWHASETVDYELILEGEVGLELDEGMVTLRAGDCVIQRGTRHRWVPTTDRPCRMLCVMVSTLAPGTEGSQRYTLK
jgi:quercetin dioxygenase-like cupin family protein